MVMEKNAQKKDFLSWRTHFLISNFQQIKKQSKWCGTGIQTHKD